jgi:hypothetical protein
MDKRFEAYRAKELNDVQAHDMLIRAMDCGAITPVQLPHVVEEWRKPRHIEFAMMPKTTWRFFNACTEVMKGMSPFTLPKRSQNLHALVDAECGISLGAELTAGTEDATAEVQQ